MKKHGLGVLLLVGLTAGLYCALYHGEAATGLPGFPLAKWVGVGGETHGTLVFEASGVLLLITSLLVYAILASVLGRDLLWKGAPPLLRLGMTVLGTSLCYSLFINSPFLATLLPERQAVVAGNLLRRYFWFLLDERDGPVAIHKYLFLVIVGHALLTYGTLLLACKLARHARVAPPSTSIA